VPTLLICSNGENTKGAIVSLKPKLVLFTVHPNLYILWIIYQRFNPHCMSQEKSIGGSVPTLLIRTNGENTGGAIVSLKPKLVMLNVPRARLLPLPGISALFGARKAKTLSCIRFDKPKVRLVATDIWIHLSIFQFFYHYLLLSICMYI